MRAWARFGRLLVGLGWEIGATVFLLYVGLNAVGFVGPLLLAVGLRPLVDGIVFDNSARVVTGALLTGIALVLAVVSPAAFRWTTIRLRERSIMVMQRRVLILSTRAARLEHFERPEFWDRLQLLQRSSFDLVMGMTLAFVGPLVLVQLGVTAVLLGRLEPVLLLLPVIAVPASWLAQRAEGLRRDGELRTAESRRTAQHLFSLASGATPAKEVRVYGLQAELLERHEQATGAVHRGTEAALFRSVALSSVSWLLFAAAYVGAVVLVLRGAARGDATPGDVALTLALVTALVAGAGRLAELSGSALRARTAAEHYYWLDDQAAAGRGGGQVAPPVRLERGIDLDGVTFSYGANGHAALTDVDLHLAPGAVVAIVGENGAGKTTLVKLLSAMYTPDAGQVRVDGIDLATIDLDAYRQRLTAGFQDFMHFEFLTRESVGVGEVSRLDDEHAVQAALGKANAGFTGRLPAGLETQLGLRWQDGVDLSGGEWQKLALARSLFREEPLLFILDEPTAALDPQTEHALFEQVAADARRSQESGRVTVLISHRFSTVRMADVIVVLDHGRVIEQGSHEELIASDGLYAELYELQAYAYR
jgi:ATP-binding cassette subfamily B protein